MGLFLDRINAAPLANESFSFEFNTWVSILVDTMNEILQQIEDSSVSRETSSATAVNAENNTQYVVGNAALTTYDCPATCEVGDIIEIVGQGAGGWVLRPAVGQTIKVVASSAGTSIASTNRYDCISIVCVVANTTWVTRNSQTAGFTIT